MAGRVGTVGRRHMSSDPVALAIGATASLYCVNSCTGAGIGNIAEQIVQIGDRQHRHAIGGADFLHRRQLRQRIICAGTFHPVQRNQHLGRRAGELIRAAGSRPVVLIALDRDGTCRRR